MRSLLLGLLLCQWSSVALSASANLIRHRKLDSSASSSTSLNSTTNSTISHSSTSSSQSSTSSPVALTPEAGKLSTTTSDAITPIPLGTVTSTTTRTSTTTAAAANVINVIHFGAIGLGAELGLGSSSSSSSSTSSTSSATSTATSTATSATTSTTSSATTPVWNATSPSLPATTTSDGLMHMDGFGMVSVDLTSTPPISLPPTATPPAITGGNPPFPLSNGTLPPFPLGNGTAAIGPTGTGRPDVCGGCTVNVRGASVDYWFPATYLYHTGTLSTVTVGSTSFYSLVYNTSPYNVTQTMLESAYTTTVSYFAEWDFYITLMDMYTTTPSAVSTIMVPRSSVLPVTGLINLDDSESLSIDPGPATVNVPLPSGTVSIATSTTPFVYFTVYEVVSRSQVTQNGQVVCSTATASFNLSQPFAFDYTGDSLEVASAAQGDIPSAFLQTIPQASCVPGKYSGDVYVLVVVDIAYDIQFNAEPFAAHGESTATSGFPSQTFSPENGHLPTTGSGNGDGGGGIGSIIVSIIGDGGETTSDPFTPEGGTLPKTTTTPRNTRTALQDNLPTTTSSGPVVVGSQTASQGSSSQVIIGSQTLTPGGPPVTIGSTVVSLGPSGTAIVVGGTTSKLGNTTPGGVIVGSQTTTKPVPVLTIGGSTITGNAATQFSVGPGATLTPGGTVVVSGTTISLDPSASFVVVGGSTQVLPTAAPTSPNGGVFTVGDSSVTGNAGSTFVIQGQTLSPGGSPITISGPGGSTTISLVGGGSTVVVNGNTEVITPVITPAPITLGGTVFSVTDGSTFVIGGQTLVPGQIITFTDGSGQVSTVSLGPSASFVVVNGQTSVLEGPITGAPLLTIGGIVYTAVSGGTTYVIDGQTLTPGGVITVDGTTISLDPYATALVINGQTETLFPATTTGDGMITTTDGRGGITTNTPVNTGAATTTKKKGAAGSLRAANKGEFLTIGISAFLAAFAVGATICL